MLSSINDLKIVLREKDIPFFSDDELEFYVAQNNGDYDAAAYQCLIIKSEDTTLSISGLSTADSSKYFKRLASKYRPRNSGILPGG